MKSNPSFISSIAGTVRLCFVFILTSLYRVRKYLVLGCFILFLLSLRQRLNRLEKHVQLVQQELGHTASVGSSV